eukprot:CAMPEP_0170490260 /NCGR_PEP_ID=MMETSP0208-20121228/8492_1 /TAXON_ID=197538 /ORGANISM="Strombidium inclinatum, Strain S3" /LENGTH=104 /DNA_ID=CAMNT_0010765567 /DNA_START=272 /DNA_END=586 /DNA_ORIENTATION=+
MSKIEWVKHGHDIQKIKEAEPDLKSEDYFPQEGIQLIDTDEGKPEIMAAFPESGMASQKRSIEAMGGLRIKTKEMAFADGQGGIYTEPRSKVCFIQVSHGYFID